MKSSRPRAYCNIGDAYTGLNQLDKALNWYMKAAAYKDNEYAAGYYKKAAIIMEETGDYTGALNLYKTIKSNIRTPWKVWISTNTFHVLKC